MFHIPNSISSMIIVYLTLNLGISENNSLVKGRSFALIWLKDILLFWLKNQPLDVFYYIFYYVSWLCNVTHSGCNFK